MIVSENDSDCIKSAEEPNLTEDIKEITYLIRQLRIPNFPFRILEKNHDRFCYILKKYQDMPQLLDPYLESFLTPLIQLIKERTDIDNLNHYVFKYIYIIMSVKKYKKIAIHLPHEVTDFKTVLEMLEKQNVDDKENWQTRYVLLIWLSIVCKIPFALSRLDNNHQNPQQTVILRVIEICKTYCISKDSCITAAIYLIANFLTRIDVKEHHLEEMIRWSLNNFEEDRLNYTPLAVIASIIKHSCRDDLVPYTQMILDKTLDIKLKNTKADLVRKFLIKIVQRIGITLLKPNITSWQYKKPTNTIILNTFTKNESENIKGDVMIENKEMNEDFIDGEDHEIPPCIEDILEYLITGLQDKYLMIRWSAAKGIGRITARLPIDLADDVLGFVLNLFLSRESENAWHGGCLALAELGRRGLLLPYRLKDIVPLVIEGLLFDEPRAHGPIGSIIRDAACFVCWSFARAFEPHVFEPYIKEITTVLLIVTCFDRQINCRRAASAAFQEIVGRHGNFPHGIDIVSACDYLAVGVRSNAYLKISVHIANYEGYLRPFCEHLIKKKVIDWDIAIRELAAKALHNLAGFCPEYTIKEILPTLMNLTDSIDSFHCHGAILAIAEIFLSLHNGGHDVNKIIEENSFNVKNIITTCRSRGQFRGISGATIKQACLTLIKNLSLVDFCVNSENIFNDWQNLLEECLANEVPSIRILSAESQAAFLNKYYLSWDAKKRLDLIERYLTNLLFKNEINRIGFAQAIGYFSESVFKDKTDDIFQKLMQCCDITKDTVSWAESRKEATNSLIKLCETLGVEKADQWKSFINDLYNCFFKGLADYTIDNRGDIGSWVREAAISGIFTLTNLVYKAGYISVLNEDLMVKIVGSISQQAVERIDRLRATAGATVYSLIHSELPNIPYHTELKNQFLPDTDNEKYVDWKLEKESLPFFIKMLSFSPYIPYVLRGLLFSIGGTSESLVKHASTFLFSYLQQAEMETMLMICQEICNIFESCHEDTRMIPPILAFLDRLLSSACIQNIMDEPGNEIPLRILTFLKNENKCIQATKSELYSIKIFCHLLQVKGSISKSAFSRLSLYLCHKFKYIRKTTASRLYESLTLYGDEMDVSEDDLSTLLTQLNSVDWEKPVMELRPIRNQLCEIMKCHVPQIQQNVK